MSDVLSGKDGCMKIYTAKEVSALLKERPAVTLDRLSRGEIPADREGRYWRIPETLLSAYIEKKALSETNARREVYEKSKMEQA